MSVKEFRFDGSKKLVLKEMRTTAGDHKKDKKILVEKTAENMAKAAELQDKLYAAGREGLIFAIQARDAAGKDSLIKKVFSCLNPAGLEVHSFKAPNSIDLSHDYLWRINQAIPARGSVSVLNRSHYEDVLIVKVHRLDKSYKMADRCLTDDIFEKRYRQLNDWELYLYENSYRIIKIFLNVSREEQRRRFMDRIELDEKHWKMSSSDMKERNLWDEYDKAYEECINATGTDYAPWYVLPADNKWYTRYLTSEILVDVLKDMNPEYPTLPAEEAAKIPQLLEELEQD